MSTALLTKALDYIKWDPNLQTRSEIKLLFDNKDDTNLSKLLNSRLAFGTAGLRGPMGGGYNRMNDLVILQTAQGLAKYLLDVVGESAKHAGIIIGYDHRKLGNLSSLNFARMTAAVFLHEGFKVYVLEGLVPTPLVAFGVRDLGCCCGIMVTASHNPKQDNGFKVYWGNGSQIIPPHDSGIAARIDANLVPWKEDYDCDNVLSHPLVADVTEDVASRYYKEIVKLACGEGHVPWVRISYTAMHGVGTKWIMRAFTEANLRPAGPTGSQSGSQADPLSIVECQAMPDPFFSTVAFPNPEEKGALNEAIKWASSHDCPVILANDPDADRLAVAERSGDHWRTFTGNEIGILLGHWLIMKHKQGSTRNNSNGEPKGTDSCCDSLPERLLSSIGNMGSSVNCSPLPAVLASVVSSRMLKTIAQAEGIAYHDTLTGFKWLGNKASELQAAGIPVLFSYEEALGYCCGSVVNDKDGISAGIVFADMVNRLYATSNSLSQRLEDIYSQYGRCVSYNSYVFCHDPALTDEIFARIRRLYGCEMLKSGTSQLTICGSVVTALKDVTLGYDSSNADGSSDLPITSDSHMLMFGFANGVSLTLRTSGTEPKIKFYTEIAGQPKSSSSAETAAATGEEEQRLGQTLRSFVDDVVSEMLEPAKHGLASP